MLGIIRRYLRIPRFMNFFSRKPTINSGLTKLEILMMNNKDKKKDNNSENIKKLNVYKGIKKLRTRELSKNNQKSENFFSLQNIIILIILLSTFIYIYINKYSVNSIYLGIFVLTIITIYLMFIERFIERMKIKKDIDDIKRDREKEHHVFLDRVKEIETIEKNQIEKLIMKDENDYDIKVWNVGRATSMLIGKKIHTNRVDIDLTSSLYSILISRIHGVLNKVNGEWYYEDLGSRNGSGIEKKSDSRKIKLKSNNTIKVESGDILYIATTKLLIK